MLKGVMSVAASILLTIEPLPGMKRWALGVAKVRSLLVAMNLALFFYMYSEAVVSFL